MITFFHKAILLHLPKMTTLALKKSVSLLKCIAFHVGFLEDSWDEQSTVLENMLFPLCYVGWG